MYLILDILYTVKKGPNNNVELRHSLRSLKNIEHGNVFIVGYKPKWAKNIIHIPYKDNPKYKAKNVIEKIRKACRDDRLSDDFVFMCDDFYIKDKVDTIPYYYKGTIEKHIEARETAIKKGARFFTFNTDVIRKTFNLDDKDFEVHFPFVYNKGLYLDMLTTYDFSRGNLYRSAYCKLYNIQGEYHEDCKLRPGNYRNIDLDKFVFFSSRNDFANIKAYKNIMNALFPEKSEYEI